MNKRIIYGVDFILLVGTLFGLFLTIGYVQPLVIAPLNGLETANTSVLFEFEKANVILLDDNLEFTSPQEIYVEDYLVVNLKPGTYYWKVQGAVSSEVREFTILSEVDLRIKDKGDKYEVVNSGNTRLNVDVYEYGKKTGSLKLDVDESQDAEGDRFVGGQDE